MPATLKVLPDGFTRKRGFRADAIRWNDLVEIVGANITKVTYDENFLIFRANGKPVETGELDKNFADFERVLLEKLPDFPLDWRTRVEAAGSNSRLTLWKRHS